MEEATIIAVANQKGGVAKTTSTIHVAAALAELGKRVLMIDMDPQGHLSEGMGFVSELLRNEMSDVLAGDKEMVEIIIPDIRPNLDLAPSNIRLADMELSLVNVRFREYRLKRALQSVMQRYDCILIDCPPSLGLLTVNSLMAAHQVMIPMTSEYLSMLGTSLLLKTIEAIKREGNPELSVLGVLHTRHKQRTVHARAVTLRTKVDLGDEVRVFDTPVNESTRFPEASGQGKTVFDIAPDLQGARVYRELAKEIANANPKARLVYSR